MISVVICTHNPRPDYFPRCLSALEEQTLPRNEWELVLIDNASAPNRAPRPDLSWHPQHRVIREEKLGLTPARLRGIREARGEILVFVDDDNLLDPDYLEQVVRIARDKPFLGSWSGQCRPEFEEMPPEWTKRYWGNLSVRTFDKDVWSNLPRLGETMPYGAGLCVRRDVAQYYVYLHQSGRRSFQFDRTGSSLISGGDNDLAACACEIGMSVGLVHALKLIHLIPEDRLTEDYLARLAEGIHFSGVLLDYQWGRPRAPRGFSGRVADFLRLLRLGRPHRRIVAAANRGRDRAMGYIQTLTSSSP